MARVFAEHRPDRGPQPRGRDARRSVDRRPAAVHRHQHRRHLRAARGGAGVRRRARRARRATRSASCTSRPTRSTARSGASGLFSEETPYAPNSPYAASKAAAGSPGARLASTPTACRSLITNCSNNYGPYQFPEKLIPLMLLNALDGTAAADLRRRRQRARLAARRGSLRRDPAGAARRGAPARSTTSAAATSAPTSRSSIASATRSTRCARRRRNPALQAARATAI